MAVYFVTGKLGAGKSLVAVSKIKEYLDKGRPVATNLDIDLNSMMGPWMKNTALYRLPDKPESTDLEIIGVGNDSYDESKNGLIVLDECGTWFNSRSWADKDRQNLINHLLHIRKKGWDVIFLIQDIGAVDKQARTMLGEMVGYCMRLDRIPIPFVTFLIKLITGYRLTLPQGHICSVRYGTLPTSPKVDTWIYRGVHLYSSYDTKQIFSDFYPNGTYSMLPSWYTHGRYMATRNRAFYMRLTKIYLKKYSRLMAFAVGCAVSSLSIAAALYQPSTPESKAPEPEALTLSSELEGVRIVSYKMLPKRGKIYRLERDGERFYIDDLKGKGVKFIPESKCSFVAEYRGVYETINCSS